MKYILLISITLVKSILTLPISYVIKIIDDPIINTIKSGHSYDSYQMNVCVLESTNNLIVSNPFIIINERCANDVEWLFPKVIETGGCARKFENTFCTKFSVRIPSNVVCLGILFIYFFKNKLILLLETQVFQLFRNISPQGLIDESSSSYHCDRLQRTYTSNDVNSMLFSSPLDFYEGSSKINDQLFSKFSKYKYHN